MKYRMAIVLSCLALVIVGLASAPLAEAQAACTIPDSGPWPPCATGRQTNNGNNATGGSNASSCVIPPSGPWPACARNGGGSPAPTTGNQNGTNSGACVIPTSGPWPPCATNGDDTTRQAAPTTTSSEQGLVTRIVDGDTIVVNLNGGLYSVRLIGIDAPESGASCAADATQALSKLVNDRWVRLEKDVSDTDRFTRLLRYVYVGDTFVNGEMVQQGYASAKRFPPDVKHADRLEQLQTEAAAENRGCSASLEGANPTPTPTPTPTPVQGDCDPHYPDVCIPNSDEDLDCADISDRNFSVPGDDPHRFDGDNDGIGCETPGGGGTSPAPTPAPPSNDSNCHPSYPDVCIPPPPPDLDCGEIPHRNFRVIGSDPHRFDRDNDGIGCES